MYQYTVTCNIENEKSISTPTVVYLLLFRGKTFFLKTRIISFGRTNASMASCYLQLIVTAGVTKFSSFTYGQF